MAAVLVNMAVLEQHKYCYAVHDQINSDHYMLFFF